MLQKKVCMLGSFAVGKTSLVARYVHQGFDEKYLTTIGVKIDKKSVDVGANEVNMIIWDLHGEDHFQKVRNSYLRGASGYLLVADCTRPATLDVAIELQNRAEAIVGQVPFLVLLNKADLTDEWKLEDDAIHTLKQRGWSVLTTSAKTGAEVEQAFHTLARQMVSDSRIE